MSGIRWVLVTVSLGLLPWALTHAQTQSDPSVLRFTHTLESNRKQNLAASRDTVAEHFLSLARELVSRQDKRRPQLLGEVLFLADSITVLDRGIEEATAAVGEARRDLLDALEAQADELRRALAANEQRRTSDAGWLEDLENEIGELRRLGDSVEVVDPFASATPVLVVLERMVVEEGAHLATLHRLQDELRLFLGDLRLFDQTGMPPSVRAEGGGDADPGVGCGCGIPSPSTAIASPGDIPMEHFSPERAGDGSRVGAEPITLASLARLLSMIATHSASHGISVDDLAGAQEHTVAREATLGVSLMTFRGDGDGMAGMRLEGGSSLSLFHNFGNGFQLTLEPSFGGRSFQLERGSSATEVAGEIRENLIGTARGGRLRWQVMSWQKGRYLSESLPLPAYLQPGRNEGGLIGRAAIPWHSGWDLELGGGGDIVRYEPDEWRPFNGQSLNAYTALVRTGASGTARLSLTGSRRVFSSEDDQDRTDTRIGVGADWSVEGAVVVRLSAAVAWNDSRLAAYDYRSGRTAVIVSAPVWGGWVQGYGALSRRSYLNPGPEDARVAPSDHDTGSILAVQITRPADSTHAVTLRAEWSRSETGFRNTFYQRFGISAQLSFRGLGRH